MIERHSQYISKRGGMIITVVNIDPVGEVLQYESVRDFANQLNDGLVRAMSFQFLHENYELHNTPRNHVFSNSEPNDADLAANANDFKLDTTGEEYNN